MPNSAGCDSVVTLNLTITQIPSASISITGNNITASPSGLNYQWIDCNNGNVPIAGATNAVFAPGANGSYAVVVSDNGCSDTSACVNFTLVGIEAESVSQIQVYPNPTDGKVLIRSEVKIARVDVWDASGRLLESSDSNFVDLSGYAKGIYFLRIHLINGNFWLKQVIRD